MVRGAMPAIRAAHNEVEMFPLPPETVVERDPLAGGQASFYSSIPESTPKILIEAGAADHWLANNPANLSGMIGRYGLSWLKVFLVSDQRYRQFLLQMPSGTTDYKSNVK
jgi:hypothetical protein